jgi:hypothetical protein
VDITNVTSHTVEQTPNANANEVAPKPKAKRAPSGSKLIPHDDCLTLYAKHIRTNRSDAAKQFRAALRKSYEARVKADKRMAHVKNAKYTAHTVRTLGIAFPNVPAKVWTAKVPKS